MSKIRMLFVLFSLVVLAAPARAQDREHGHGKGRGDAEHRRDDERGDKRAERDDDENDDDENGIGSMNRNGRDDDENDDSDDNEDGDDRGAGRSGCTDANGNNVCNVIGQRLPSTLPEMANAVLISRGQLTRSGRSWVGGTALTPRFTGSANRAPRQVAWVDRRGATKQLWLDTNGDGRADIVKMYRRGRLVRTVHR